MHDLFGLYDDWRSLLLLLRMSTFIDALTSMGTFTALLHRGLGCLLLVRSGLMLLRCLLLHLLLEDGLEGGGCCGLLALLVRCGRVGTWSLLRVRSLRLSFLVAIQRVVE